MTRHKHGVQLGAAAQPSANTPLTNNSWSSDGLKTLVTKGLVEQSDTKPRTYKLTPDGEAVSRKLVARTSSVELMDAQISVALAHSSGGSAQHSGAVGPSEAKSVGPTVSHSACDVWPHDDAQNTRPRDEPLRSMPKPREGAVTSDFIDRTAPRSQPQPQPQPQPCTTGRCGPVCAAERASSRCTSQVDAVCTYSRANSVSAA
jgi:hypothetical protein